MKITFVFNKITWPSIPAKLAAVKEFFAPDFDFTITEIHTDFHDIPWVQTGALGDLTNTPGVTQTVDKEWFDTNISAKTPEADIVLFCLAPDEVPPHMTSVGIMQGKVGSVVQCCIFGLNETDESYINQVKQDNSFVLFAEHELSHALYLLQRMPDNTHAYFYTGQPTKVLEDLKKGYLTGLSLLLAKCKQLLLALQYQYKTMTVPSFNVPPALDPDLGPIIHPSKGQMIYDKALSLKGQYLSMNPEVPKTLNCAETISYILNECGYEMPTGGFPGTGSIEPWLETNFQEILEPELYCIINAVTQGQNHGHIAIQGHDALLSNDSQTGTLESYWTLGAFQNFYRVQKGLKIRYFRAV